MVSQPKRQHFVPRAYLARFAVDGKVLVRRRDGAVFAANPTNVAVEGGMYDIPAPSGGRSPVLEEALADVEGAAAAAMQEIDSTGQPCAAGSESRFVLSAFLAIQMTRTAESRERAAFPIRVAEFVGDRKLTKELVLDFLEQVHHRAKPSEREVEGAHAYASYALKDGPLTSENTMQAMFASVRELFPLIYAMSWTIESDRKGRLITSDSPLVIWRKPSPRDKYEGIGIVNAEEVRFPLDPSKQLVLSPRSKVTTARMTGERARACNADVADGSHKFIIGRPDRRPLLEGLRLADHRPVLRFDVGPGFESGPDGKLTRMEGDILHVWVPRR